MRTALVAISLICSLAAAAAQPDNGVGRVKKQSQEAKRQASETSGKLKRNQQETARSLRELNVITLDIDQHQRDIGQLEAETDQCQKRIRLTNDSIRRAERRLDLLRKNYGNAVRKMRSRASGLDKVVFVFSASSAAEAYRRMRYLRLVAKWRDKQTKAISQEVAALTAQRASLEKLTNDNMARTQQLGEAKASLEKRQQEQSDMLASLRKKEKELKKLLDEQNRRAQELDKELDRMLAQEAEREAQRQAQIARQKQEEEQRLQAAQQSKRDQDSAAKAQPAGQEPQQASQAATPAKKQQPQIDESKLTAGFESSKGKLPYPIAGQCRVTRPFGRQRHPELKHVMTDNGGIDIDAPKGAEARAVFDGRVSAVFRQDGYDMVVMVRHGKYLTIYVNLSEIYVGVGDIVKAGYGIGKIATDTSTGDRATLHFEIRNERQKLNPSEWLQPPKNTTP